jgi:hypothetical protein
VKHEFLNDPANPHRIRRRENEVQTVDDAQKHDFLILFA